MGLLTIINDKKKSIIDKNVYPEYVINDNKKKNQIQDFFKEAESLDQGFEYANNLLLLYSKLMDFKKAALLASDFGDKLFVPVSCLDIDLTTVRHLRIKYTVFSSQFNGYFKNLKRNDNTLKILKHYFSIREYSALNSVVLVPFYSKGNIKSVLIIIDPTEQTLKICKEISLKSEKLILKLWKSRNPFTINSTFEEDRIISDPVLLLQGIINSLKNQNDISLLLITIDFDSLKKTILNYLPNEESYEISNDIFKAISRLVTPAGKIYKINSVKCLLFYKIKKGKSPGIILHQLNLAISTFFNLPASLPNIETSIKEINYDKSVTADTILAGLI